MIREPYNINPYNSTIDTSIANTFGFTFSGDELGSWKVEIAENNTSPDMIYTSEEFYPSNVGYDRIFDGDDIVMAMPSALLTNGKDDGWLSKGTGNTYILTVEDRSTTWPQTLSNLTVQINNYSFTISSKSGPTDGYTDLTITASPFPDLEVNQSVKYIIYDRTTTAATSYLSTVGNDCIWRLLLKTKNTERNNFIKNGKFLQDASTRGGVYTDSTLNQLYEGEISTFVSENFNQNATVNRTKVQIGDDFFVKTITIGDNSYTATAEITPSINYTDLVIDMSTFATLINTNKANIIFEIDSRIYTITSSTYNSTTGSIDLVISGSQENISSLIINNYYNYTMQFLSSVTSSLINGYVDRYKYTRKSSTASENQIGVRIGTTYLQNIANYYQMVYSDGSIRAFYHLGAAIPNFTRGMQYRLYSNFYYSNWYFFQSRKAPTLTIALENSTPFPLVDYNSRRLKVVGTYSQIDGADIRYHSWKLDKVTDTGTIEINHTNEIYNADFKYIYEPLDEHDSYVLTFTVVNQDGVESSVVGNITTNVEAQELAGAECIATTDNDNHVVEVTWLNGLGSEPDSDSTGTFNNKIGVGPSGQDVVITPGNELTYSTVSGGNIAIDKDSITVQAGLIINDVAEDGFYDSNILTLGSQRGSIHFKKEGLKIKIEDNANPWFTLLEDTVGQVNSNTFNTANYYLGKNYIWDDSETWTDSYYWVETQSNTNCYYYQFVIGPSAAKGKKAAYWNGVPSASDSTSITIPYNPLLYAANSSLKARIFTGTNGSENITYPVSSISRQPTTNAPQTMKLNFNSIPTTISQVVVYDNTGTALPDENNTVTSSDQSVPYNRFILGSDTNYFYFTVIGNNSYGGTSPKDFGVKPMWDENDKTLINLPFNGSLLSSRQSDVDGTIIGYQVYRRKFKIIGSNGMEPIYDEEPIYTRLIGTFYLADEDLVTAAKFRFIDWTVENRGTYDYIIIPISDNTTMQATIHSQQKVSTDWYGWSFASFDEFPSGHFEPLERWLFKLNVETGGYSHQTNKVFNQGFNRYPKVSIGTINYITTNLTCLIGNIDKELRRSVLYRTLQGYTNDNINRIEDWENFSNSSNLVLIKDYKGRAFIGVIDGNAMSFQDIVIEILTKLSFNVTQIDDAANYQIFSVEEG